MKITMFVWGIILLILGITCAFEGAWFLAIVMGGAGAWLLWDIGDIK